MKVKYHKVVIKDLLDVASKEEKQRMSIILDVALEKRLAARWCRTNGYKLGGYLGGSKWDATKG